MSASNWLSGIFNVSQPQSTSLSKSIENPAELNADAEIALSLWTVCQIAAHCAFAEQETATPAGRAVHDRNKPGSARNRLFRSRWVISDRCRQVRSGKPPKLARYCLV